MFQLILRYLFIDEYSVFTMKYKIDRTVDVHNKAFLVVAMGFTLQPSLMCRLMITQRFYPWHI